MGKEYERMSGLRLLLKRFGPYFKEYIPQFVFAIIGMIAASLGAAASAYLVKPVLDEIFIAKDENLLYLLPYAIIAVYVIKEAGRYTQAYFTAYIGQDIVRRFRNRVLENLLSQDIAFFHKFRSGELISRNINDIERIRLVVSNLIPEIIRESVTIIGLLAVVMYQSLALSFFALIIMPLAIVPLGRLAKRMKKVSRHSQETTSDLSSRLSEIFGNIEIIKAHAAEKFEIERFKIDNAKFFKLNLKSVKISQLSSPIMETLGAIGVAVVIIIGGQSVIDGEMSVGSFFSFLAALFMLYTPIKRISYLYNQMQDAIAASERTFYLLDQVPTIKGGDLPVPEVKNIEFKNVSLCYGEKPALDEISLHVKRGDFIALVGDSGGGKSSLVNLLVRFYDPSGGEIRLNDEPLNKYDLSNLRRNIAIVTQRVYVFHDTIAANVAYGEDVDEDRVVDALKKANAYDFVQALDDGIHTILDEHGTNLSGGQRQRIAIARAIYQNPQILILDEATSALDTASEQKISDALEYLIKDRITIVIAHRLSTIEKADRIVVLKHGKIVAIGSDRELRANSRDYQALQGL
jgi:subfamily B ATP-binding cassette protein MsbA